MLETPRSRTLGDGQDAALTQTALGIILCDVLAARLPATARRWLERARLGARCDFDPVDFASRFAAATARLGGGPVDLDGNERDKLRRVAPGWRLAGWTLDELARAVLLLSAATGADPNQLATVVAERYRVGDTGQRCAIVRALAWLPSPGRFLPVAIDAARTADSTLFAALAVDNPYAARHFSDPQYEQMVLKALALGIELDRIVGLDERAVAKHPITRH